MQAISEKFRVFGTVTASGRRRVALMLANEQILCYLQLNNPRQCKPLTDWADQVSNGVVPSLHAPP